MRELTYLVAVTVDGFIAADDGTADMLLAAGDHMDVVVGEYADALPAHVLAAMGLTAPGTMFDTVIQGRHSYQVALDAGIERPYAHLREYVATTSTEPAPRGVTFTADPVRTVRELKAEPGLGIYLCGGGALAGSVIDEIDRLVLKRSPVVLGAGIPMFGGATGAARPFEMIRARRFDSGVVIEEYARAT